MQFKGIRIPFMARCTRYNNFYKECQWLAAGRWFSPLSSTKENWPLRYNWYIVESGIKHHATNPNSIESYHI